MARQNLSSVSADHVVSNCGKCYELVMCNGINLSKSTKRVSK